MKTRFKFFLKEIFYFFFLNKKSYRDLFKADKFIKLNNKYLIENLKEDIFQQKLNIKNNFFFNKIDTNFDIEISVRQYLVEKLTTNNFCISILKSIANKKKIIYPLPSEWFSHIENNDIKVNKFFSNTLFLIYALVLTILNYYYSLIELLLQTKYLFSKNKFSKKSYFFLFLNHSNINGFTKNKNYGVVSSVYEINKNYLKTQDNFNFYHTVHSIPNVKIKNIEIKSCNNFLPNITSLYIFFKCLFWLHYYFIISFLLIFFNKWHYGIMLYEKYKSIRILFHNHDNFSEKYFYPHANFIYKPLWALELENKGSKVIQYYYSISNEAYELNQKIYRYKMGFNLMTWKNYYAWDKFHKDFIISNCLHSNPDILVCGPISHRFYDNNINILNNSVLCFDVQPHRYSEYIRYRHPYYGDLKNIRWNDAIIKFIKESFEISNQFKCNFGLKRKRSLDNQYKYLSDKKYNNNLNRLNNANDNFYEINSEVDPHQLFSDVNKIKLVICLPFTSVSYIAKYYGIPVIFYDPFDMVPNKTYITREIPLIRSKKELYSYFKSL
tara:strand:+ start:14235 stop:15893 length:1659 start_codon:yes stop_codon:yes gene_type:complete